MTLTSNKVTNRDTDEEIERGCDQASGAINTAASGVLRVDAVPLAASIRIAFCFFFPSPKGGQGTLINSEVSDYR